MADGGDIEALEISRVLFGRRSIMMTRGSKFREPMSVGD
jgi:hypothetical protein